LSPGGTLKRITFCRGLYLLFEIRFPNVCGRPFAWDFQASETWPVLPRPRAWCALVLYPLPVSALGQVS